MNRTFTPELDAGVLARLEEYAAHFAGDSNRPRQRAWCAVYLAGLLQDGERKSIELLSRRVTLPATLQGTQAPDQGLRQFVSQSSRDEQAVAARCRALLAGTFADAAGVLVLDDPTFPKAGTHSVGVQRQDGRALGKKANCQAAVSLHYVDQGRATCRWAWPVLARELAGSARAPGQGGRASRRTAASFQGGDRPGTP